MSRRTVSGGARSGGNLSNAINQAVNEDSLNSFTVPLKSLVHFDKDITDQYQSCIPFVFDHYLTLVDWTGRAIRIAKLGSIALDLPPILNRLNIDTKRWLVNSTAFEMHCLSFKRVAQ